MIKFKNNPSLDRVNVNKLKVSKIKVSSQITNKNLNMRSKVDLLGLQTQIKQRSSLMKIKVNN